MEELIKQFKERLEHCIGHKDAEKAANELLTKAEEQGLLKVEGRSATGLFNYFQRAGNQVMADFMWEIMEWLNDFYEWDLLNSFGLLYDKNQYFQ